MNWQKPFSRIIALAFGAVIALPFITANSAFETLGRLWQRIDFVNVYTSNLYAAQAIDAIITFMIIFTIVYEVSSKGTRKMPKAVGIALGLIVWLPLVIYMQQTQITLLTYFWVVLVAVLIVTSVLYRSMLNVVENFISAEAAKNKANKVILFLLSSSLVSFMLGRFLMASRTGGGAAEEAVKGAVSGFYAEASGWLMIVVFLALLGAGLRLKRAGRSGRGTTPSSEGNRIGGAFKDYAERKSDSRLVGDLSKQITALDEGLSRSLGHTDDAIKQFLARLQTLRGAVTQVTTSLQDYATKNVTREKLPPEQLQQLDAIAHSYPATLKELATKAAELANETEVEQKQLKALLEGEGELARTLIAEDKVALEIQAYENKTTDHEIGLVMNSVRDTGAISTNSMSPEIKTQWDAIVGAIKRLAPLLSRENEGEKTLVQHADYLHKAAKIALERNKEANDNYSALLSALEQEQKLFSNAEKSLATIGTAVEQSILTINPQTAQQSQEQLQQLITEVDTYFRQHRQLVEQHATARTKLAELDTQISGFDKQYQDVLMKMRQHVATINATKRIIQIAKECGNDLQKGNKQLSSHVTRASKLLQELQSEPVVSEAVNSLPLIITAMKAIESSSLEVKPQEELARAS